MNLELKLNEMAEKLYGKTIAACTDAELYHSLLQFTKKQMAEKPVIEGKEKGLLCFHGISDWQAVIL